MLFDLAMIGPDGSLPAVLPGPDLAVRPAGPMNGQDVLGGVIVLFLGIYLLYTLLRAERF